jgi:phosphoribosylformylglycinamidine synthase
MVSRVYVEKKAGFDVKAQQLRHELTSILGIAGLTGLRLLNRYDVEGISDDLFARCVPTVFSEPAADDVYYELPDAHGAAVFAIEALPGQFDQRADSASECTQLISQGERPTVRNAQVYYLEGDLSAADVAAVKHYLINPVESREASLAPVDALTAKQPAPGPVEVLTGFNELDEDGLARFLSDRELAMDFADIAFCQQYFRSEQRDPTITEIKMIDTYWSDHCRHTTFGTHLTDVKIDDAVVEAGLHALPRGASRAQAATEAVSLMDMGTIGAKYLKSKGILKNLDESEEINACTVKVKVDVNGKDEDWLFLFKNETAQPPDRDRAVWRRGHVHRRRHPRPAVRPQPTCTRPCA